MIPISEAIEIIKRETGSLGLEKVDLADSVSRVLAEHIIADTDLPPFDRSQMDGFAVRSADTRKAPVTLKIVGESAAGKGWHSKLKSGEAVRIMTGAPVSKGADAVQKVELTSEAGVPWNTGTGGTSGTVTINEPVTRGQHIVRQGTEIKRGERVFAVGEIITPRMIASLAAFGYADVPVAVKPRVAVVTTGSEIVEIAETPGQDQIRNSNSPMLKILAEDAGAIAFIVPSVVDDLDGIKTAIKTATADAEILVITGGVSVGKYDLTKLALKELGTEIFFERVRLKPGKPTVFARLNDTLIFGLPGNPVSAAVTFYLFVRMAILQMQGAADAQLREGFAILGADIKAARERDTYLPASLDTNDKGQLTAEPLRWHGSSDFIGFARADALIFVPKGVSIARGKAAKILFL